MDTESNDSSTREKSNTQWIESRPAYGLDDTAHPNEGSA